MNQGMYNGLKESLDQASKQAKVLSVIGIILSVMGLFLMITQIAVAILK